MKNKIKIKESDYINIERFMQKVTKYAKVSEENDSISKKWFLIAKDDMDISLILHKKKHYASSIYHLEQAFEKLIKGFYIQTGRLSPEDAKGHDFVIKRLKDEFTKFDDINQMLEITSLINDKTFSIENVDQNLETLKKNEDELRNISQKEILKLLSFLENLESKLKSSESLKILEEKMKTKKSLGFIKQVLIRLTKFRIKNSEVIEAIDKYNLKNYIEQMVIGMKLHLLSVITFPHWNVPRYPDCTPFTEMTFFDYNKEMGIFKSTKKLSIVFNEILKIIDNQNETKNSTPNTSP